MEGKQASLCLFTHCGIGIACVPAVLLKCSRPSEKMRWKVEWQNDGLISCVLNCINAWDVYWLPLLDVSRYFLSRGKELYVYISKHWHYYTHSRMKTPAIVRLRITHHIGTSAVHVRRWNNKENCVDCLKTTTVRELRADATPFSQSMSPNNFAFIIHFRFSFLFHFIYFSNLFGFNSFELKVLQQIEIKNFEIAVDGTVQTLRWWVDELYDQILILQSYPIAIVLE